MSVFFHEAGKTNEKLMIITPDHYIHESSWPDTVFQSV